MRRYLYLSALILFLLITGISARQARTTQAHLNRSTHHIAIPQTLQALNIILGSFRTLLSEVLWYRATTLQDRGDYIALTQLTHWITALDPTATQAWAYTAWNLAFNISVLQRTDEARWYWVKQGLDHLEHNALTYNPGNAELCRELAWIYLFKLAGSLDKAAPYYREQLAKYPPLTQQQLQNQLSHLPLLDPRLPETIALYWTEVGLSTANATQRATLERLAIHALASLVIHHQQHQITPYLLKRIDTNILTAPSIYTPLKRAILQHLSSIKS